METEKKNCTIKHYSFYGLPVSRLTENDLWDYYDQIINHSQKRVIYGYSLYSIYAIKRTPEIFTLGIRSDLFLADGRPFFWLCKAVGLPLLSGISIPESVMTALKYANYRKLKVMLVGASTEINIDANYKLKFSYPDATFLSGYHGYFQDSETSEVISLINRSKPDLLLVGMSSPKKEKFVFNNLEEINASIIIPCGGMIDVLAGKTKMTPKWLKRIGMASFYRVLQEPKRLLLDRLKMLGFLFVRFFPSLIAMRISGKEFSIPNKFLECKTNQDA